MSLLWWAVLWSLLVLLSSVAGFRLFLWMLGRVTLVSCDFVICPEITGWTKLQKMTGDRLGLGPCQLCRWHLGDHQYTASDGRHVTFNGRNSTDYWAVEVFR